MTTLRQSTNDTFQFCLIGKNMKGLHNRRWFVECSVTILLSWCEKRSHDPSLMSAGFMFPPQMKEGHPFFLTLWIIIRMCIAAESRHFGDAWFTWNSDVGSLVIKVWSLLRRDGSNLPFASQKQYVLKKQPASLWRSSSSESVSVPACAPRASPLPSYARLRRHMMIQTLLFQWTDHCQSALIHRSRWDTKQM